MPKPTGESKTWQTPAFLTFCDVKEDAGLLFVWRRRHYIFSRSRLSCARGASARWPNATRAHRRDTRTSVTSCGHWIARARRRRGSAGSWAPSGWRRPRNSWSPASICSLRALRLLPRQRPEAQAMPFVAGKKPAASRFMLDRSKHEIRGGDTASGRPPPDRGRAARSRIGGPRLHLQCRPPQ